MSSADEIGKAEIFKLTGQILTAHVANNSVASDDLARLIGSVHQALSQAANPAVAEFDSRFDYHEEPEHEPEAAPPSRTAMPLLPPLPPGAMMMEDAPPPQEPMVPIKESITPDRLFCLECGRGMKLLKRHLRMVHELTPEQYRRKWHLPRKYPMAAPEVSAEAGTRAKRPGGPADKMKEARERLRLAALPPVEPPEPEPDPVPVPEPEPALVPAHAIADSIQPHALICLECGKRVKALTLHLRHNHRLAPEDYRAKWGLPNDYPMLCPDTEKFYVDRAKARGLGSTIQSSRKKAAPLELTEPVGRTRLALIEKKAATG